MSDMSDTDDQNDESAADKKPLKLSKPGRLELKKTVDGGQVRQSFSHGRSRAVAVEVKKKRTFKRGDAGVMSEIETVKAVPPAAEAPPPPPPPPPWKLRRPRKRKNRLAASCFGL